MSDHRTLVLVFYEISWFEKWTDMLRFENFVDIANDGYRVNRSEALFRKLRKNAVSNLGDYLVMNINQILIAINLQYCRDLENCLTSAVGRASSSRSFIISAITCVQYFSPNSMTFCLGNSTSIFFSCIRITSINSGARSCK